MAFGNILKHAVGEEISTADNKKTLITKFSAYALGLIGLPHTGLRERERQIRDFIKNGKVNALDAGCGIGLYSFEIAKNGHSVTGIDLERNKIETARKISNKIGAKVNFIEGDLTNLKINEKFDLILCSEVIEHIIDDYRVIENLSKIMNKNARLIITVPRISEKSWKIDYKKFGHVRPGYREEELKTMLEKYGLKVNKIVLFDSPLATFAFRINERLYNKKILLGLLFYPLYWLTFFNYFKKGKYNGLLIEAIKQ
ncbi:methyltransferase domain-containing protein [Candidatus Pacearchaeota archaeon]|nr:methyltransferase domain-containing protein [Candidatus Pacearchaeota archaeon]